MSHTHENLTLIGASAGSGKTYRLTQEVTRALDPNQPHAIDVEALLAVTYTRKAAAELGSRIRHTLIESHALDRAQRLPLAHIGTVHAVCLRLVQAFAIDAGLSPHVEVLSGNEASALREALERGLEPAFRARLQMLADSLRIRFDSKQNRTDWLLPVHDIMTLARSNRIAPAHLPAMAERSAAGVIALLGPPEKDGDGLDRQLLTALGAAKVALAAIQDGQGNTATVREAVERLLRDAERGVLPWHEWLAAQKLEPGRTARHAVAPLIAVASRVDGHPRLRQELHAYILCAYQAARLGLESYEAWKTSRRVVDYVDMVDRALSLSEHPDVATELRQRLKLVVVDEFQDTSPLQLALFTRLHHLADRSTWVGDRKQCIFEYAGADPVLMDAVTRWVTANGGRTEQLPRNYRSRPELVRACSRIFAAAFARHGYRAEEVVVEAARPSALELEALPPFGLWSLDTKNAAHDAAAMALGVARLLTAPQSTPVIDRISKTARPLRAGDVAVLLATNKETHALADALAALGIRAAIARAGLLATPEGTFVAAAMSFLVDERDTLSIRILHALTGFSGKDPDAWLAELVAIASSGERQFDVSPYAVLLRELKPSLNELSPTEAVDRVLAALDLASLCARWPDPDQRLANLDALRALAAHYEDHCQQRREAATLSGALRYFRESSQTTVVRDEEIASDDQHVSADVHAVTITTYHRAKGLEWPVVVMASLNRGDRRDVLNDVCPETDCASFDPEAPLAGRWIRYWPWPFGAQKNGRLRDVAKASPEGLAVAQREERERVRLLYVGFTRARDHLVLAVRKSKQGYETEWLDELRAASGDPLLVLPAVAAARELESLLIADTTGATQGVPMRCWSLASAAATSPRDESPSRPWIARPTDGPHQPRTPYWIAPWRADTEWPELPVPEVGASESFDARMPIGNSAETSWDVVGNVVHAFLAADVAELSADQRFERARRLLLGANLAGVLSPDALLCAGDQLRRWVHAQWPGAHWEREVPVMGRITSSSGVRGVAGAIDLLLDTPEGVVVIDHKTFPGGQRAWAQKATTFAPQMAAYAELLRAAGKTVLGAWVHFPVAGGVVRVV